jgi:transcriptional regulator with XRE-family HTH domain
MSRILRPQLPALPPGRKIRQWRTSEYMTQADCAALLGISPVQLSRIERGEIEVSESVTARLAALRGKTGAVKTSEHDAPTYAFHAPSSGFLSAIH